MPDNITRGIETANRLMSSLFPNLKIEQTDQECKQATSKTDRIALYLDQTDGREWHMSIRPNIGPYLTRNNRSMVPSAYYRLWIFDTGFEARAAQSALQRSVDYKVESGTLDSGEGVLLSYRRFEKATMSDLTIAIDEAMIRFDGTNGVVGIDIHDERMRPHKDDNYVLSRRSVVRPSFMIERGEAGHPFDSFRDRPISTLRRAAVLYRMIEDAMTDKSSLRVFQDMIEKIPGAKVSFASLSSEHIGDIYDDITFNLENSQSLVSDEAIQAKLLLFQQTHGFDSSEVGKAIAWELVSGRRVEDF